MRLAVGVGLDVPVSVWVGVGEGVEVGVVVGVSVDGGETVGVSVGAGAAPFSAGTGHVQAGRIRHRKMMTKKFEILRMKENIWNLLNFQVDYPTIAKQTVISKVCLVFAKLHRSSLLATCR